MAARPAPALLLCWCALVVGFAIRAFAAHVTVDTSAPVPFRPHVVDLNAAGIAELATLPGIGPGRAAAIVLDRVRRGPFARLDELARVAGIGPATVAALRPHARAGPIRNPLGER